MEEAGSTVGDSERVLFVHAHPDDESLATGGTIATLIAQGAYVAVLTCTRGELGEVIPDDLAHLRDDPDALAAHRETELAAAMRELGVGDHRFLGAPGARMAGREPRRYTDSGMQWGEAGAMPLEVAPEGSLCAAEYGEVVSDIATVIADTRPWTVVSYDERGGYGHPDHVLAHDAARHAAQVLGVPYFAIVADGATDAGLVRVDVAPVLQRKRAALRAHRTQLVVEGDTILHSGGQRQPLGVVESFAPRPVEPAPPEGWERMSGRWRTATVALAAVGGVAMGAVLTVGHQWSIFASDAPVWIGAIAALLVATALLVGLRVHFGNRVVVGAAAVGMLLATAVLAMEGPGGSVMVPSNTAGWLWAYGPVVIAVLVLAWPRLRMPARGSMRIQPEAKGPDSL